MYMYMVKQLIKNNKWSFNIKKIYNKHYKYENEWKEKKLTYGLQKYEEERKKINKDKRYNRRGEERYKNWKLIGNRV